MHDGLKLISSKEFKAKEDMYKVIDFLNKNLAEYGFIFGISMKHENYFINIYKYN